MAETAKPKLFLELKEICKENSVTINLNSNVEEMNSKEQRSITPGGVLPYLGYTGTCRWTGYGFLASLS